MAKSLELSNKQHEILVELLQSTLSELSYEIADTDVSTFRDQLKERRVELQAIAEKLSI